MLYIPVLILTSLLTVTEAQTRVSTTGRCGKSYGLTCAGSTFGGCCSKNNWCGSSSDHCGSGCQSGWGTCGSNNAPVTKPISKNARCGAAYNGQTCQGSAFGNCCSSYGYCGSDSSYCAASTCQKDYGTCKGGPVPSVPPTTLASVVVPASPHNSASPAASSLVPVAGTTVTVTTTVVPSANDVVTITVSPSTTPTVTVTLTPSDEAIEVITVTVPASSTPTITVTLTPSDEAIEVVTVTVPPSSTPTVTLTLTPSAEIPTPLPAETITQTQTQTQTGTFWPVHHQYTLGDGKEVSSFLVYPCTYRWSAPLEGLTALVLAATFNLVNTYSADGP